MNPFFNEQQSSQNFEKHLTDITLAKHNYNITKIERDQLNFISNTFDLVITKADKEAKLILIDKSDYNKECLRQLNNMDHYVKLEISLKESNERTILKILSNAVKNEYIDTKLFNKLKPRKNSNFRRFYILLKTHKDKSNWPSDSTPPGRPIITNINTETSKISEYLQNELKSIVYAYETCILKNTTHLIYAIEQLRLDSNENYFLFTADITALYTNIDLKKALICIKEALQNNNK